MTAHITRERNIKKFYTKQCTSANARCDIDLFRNRAAAVKWLFYRLFTIQYIPMSECDQIFCANLYMFSTINAWKSEGKKTNENIAMASSFNIDWFDEHNSWWHDCVVATNAYLVVIFDIAKQLIHQWIVVDSQSLFLSLSRSPDLITFS